ncbi:MAG: hypothetical protein KDD82_16225 [Planctomycetes bacterium]|nr:hypothetical protein [Planctomycetota bacterium]
MRSLTSSALLGLALFASGAVAQPVSLPTPERLVYERGIEWGAYHAQTKLVLVRQADGSYLADVSGEEQTARTGVVIPAEKLLALRARLKDMQSFPDEGFGATGNHWYTRLEASGDNGWSLKRFFFDTNDAGLDARAAKLERVVLALIQGPSAAPQLERFVYERGIEWGGDHAQLRLELTRQADGSYRANVSGEKHVALTDVAVSDAQLAELRGALDTIQSFPGGGDNSNHWYTRFELEGRKADGSAWTETRSLYDPSGGAAMREVSALEGVVARLAKSLVPAAPSGGLSGGLAN